MNCTAAQERFSELLDGRLAQSDTAEVQAHLSTCPDCQREYAALAQTLATVQEFEAKGFLGTVGKIAAATVIFFVAIGLVAGLVLGYFIGRAVGRRQGPR